MEIYKLVYQYSYTHSIPNTPNSSLTNNKEQRFVPYSKLENSHKYAATNLSISLSFFFSSIAATHVLFIHGISRLRCKSFKEQKLYYIQFLYVHVQNTNPMEKMGKCPFQKNNPAFCPTSQTNQGNAPLLKLDFLKIKL